MEKTDFLQNIAQDPDWISFAESLSSALRNPGEYGFTDSERLLARVAEMKGSDPSSLRNPLKAYSWLERNAQDALKLSGQKLPMTGVLTLSQIWELSQEVGLETAPKFIKGVLARKDLKAILKDLQQQMGGRGVRGHERYKNSVAFEELVREFLIDNKTVLGLGPETEIVSSGKDALVPSDLTVLFRGEPVGAIEIKSHRHKRHRRYLVETLAMAALLAKEYDVSILVVPSSWDTSISEMLELIRELRLRRLRLAVFHESSDPDPWRRFRFATAESEPFNMLPQALD